MCGRNARRGALNRQRFYATASAVDVEVAAGSARFRLPVLRLLEVAEGLLQIPLAFVHAPCQEAALGTLQ